MILQRYLLRQLLVSFCFSLSGVAVTVLPALGVSAVQKFAGIGILAVIGYLPIVAVDIMPFLLPIAFVLAVVATFGRLAADNEWTAIVGLGIHPLKALVAPVLVAICLSLVSAVVLCQVRPHWKNAQFEYQANAVRAALQALSPGRTEIQFGEFYVNAGSRTGNLFIDAIIEIPREGLPSRTLLADTAAFSFLGGDLVATLVDARSLADDEYVRIERAQMRIPMSLLIPSESQERSAARYYSSLELLRRMESGLLSNDQVLAHRYEFHRRNALATSFLAFALVGTALGLSFKSPNQLSALGYAVAVALLYHVSFLVFGESFGALKAAWPATCAWATNAIGLVVGVVWLRLALWR